jgi:hypothetical protein
MDDTELEMARLERRDWWRERWEDGRRAGVDFCEFVVGLVVLLFITGGVFGAIYLAGYFFTLGSKAVGG